MSRTALITGIAGQDGSYLAVLLREHGYRVYGLVQCDGVVRPDVAAHLQDVELVKGDLRDTDSLREALALCSPDEVYNLAGVSSVALSWQQPELTADVNGTAVLRLMRALMEYGERTGRTPRLLQASSSEMFGSAATSPQDEATPLKPRNPYALSKAFAHDAVGTFREGFGLFACTAILFNHESPLRPPAFVTRKITRTVAAISLGEADGLVLGDLDIRRDWGSAKDYVRAMWLALQTDQPRDYVVATGQTHSIRDWVATAFACVGVEDWESLVRSDPTLIRPTEPGALVGDASRASALLDWRPTTTFEDLVATMVQSDLQSLRSSM